MFGSRSARRRAALRFARLFGSAIRDFDQRMRAIIAAQAAKGLLESGSTIRAAVRATSEVTHDAVNEALAGIASVTDHAGSARKAMLAELAAALAIHHAAIEASARDALGRIGLRNDTHLAEPLFSEERERHAALISDFEGGWTAPAGKRWHERHPILYAGLIAILGIVLGWIAKSLIGDQWTPTLRSKFVAHHVAQTVFSGAATPENPT